MVKSFLKYYKPYMTILIGVIIGTFVMAGLDLIFPIVVRYLINEILPSKNMHQLFIGSGVLLFLYIVNFIVQYAVQYYGHIMSASIEHDMRSELFRHIEKLSFHYFDNEKTGQLLSRITSDVTEISDLAFRGPNDVLLCGVIMAGTYSHSKSKPCYEKIIPEKPCESRRSECSRRREPFWYPSG